MDELIFLIYGIKYQTVQKIILIFKPEGNGRRKHKVIRHAAGPIHTIHGDAIQYIPSIVMPSNTHHPYMPSIVMEIII